MQEDDWKQYALINNYQFMIICKDLEDKDYFPVYFNFQSEVNNYANNIISESKLKIISIHKM